MSVKGDFKSLPPVPGLTLTSQLQSYASLTSNTYAGYNANDNDKMITIICSKKRKRITQRLSQYGPGVFSHARTASVKRISELHERESFVHGYTWNTVKNPRYYSLSAWQLLKIKKVY